MHGPEVWKSDRPIVNPITGEPLRNEFERIRAFEGFSRSIEFGSDKSYIHSYEWAIGMMKFGRKVRKKDWPTGQYTFLLDKAGNLHGNILIIDANDLQNLLRQPLRPMVMRADSSDETCAPQGDLGDITTNDWAIYE
jgi:hypothetical protein